MEQLVAYIAIFLFFICLYQYFKIKNLKVKQFNKTKIDIYYSALDYNLELNVTYNDRVVVSKYLGYKDLLRQFNLQNYLQANGLNTKTTPKVEQKTDPWFILGIMPTTDKELVEAAYRKQCKIFHPDLGGTKERFNILSKAKE